MNTISNRSHFVTIMTALLMASPERSGNGRGNNAPQQEQIAPAQPEAQPEAPAGPVNRFIAAFTGLQFSLADGNRVFENERDGSKSKKLANVLVEIGGTGAYIRGTVYARLKKNAAAPYAEFTFMGAQMQSAIVAQDAKAKAELDEWKSLAAQKFAAWYTAQNIQPTANVPTAAPTLDGVTF